jgi:uncharacterized membrane protein YuzA (DUF378 family)
VAAPLQGEAARFTEGGFQMKAIDVIAAILLIIGGLNWGLVGIFDWNLVSAIFGAGSVIARIIYILVGLSAIWQIIFWKGSHMRLAGTAGSAAPKSTQQPVG